MEYDAVKGCYFKGVLNLERKIYLSRNKVIGGVAGGIAEYFGVDPTIVRLLWVLAVFSGAGVPAYVVAMFIIPERPVPDPNSTTEIPVATESRNTNSSDDSQRSLGIILIAVGVVFLTRSFLPWFPWTRVWPVVLILAGVGLLYKGMGGSK